MSFHAHRAKWRLCVITVLSCATLPLLAASPESPHRSELRADVQRLWQRNPEVAAARASLDAARARATSAALPLYNPSLQIGTEQADMRRDSVGFSLPLDMADKRGARRKAGAADLRAAEAALARVRRDVAARWLKAWFADALAEASVRLGEQRLVLMQRFDQLAAQRLEVGDISAPERDLAALALSEATVQQAGLAGQAASTHAALQALGDVGDERSRDLPDAPPPALDGTVELDTLPELREAQARSEGAEAQTSVAKRNKVLDPVISLSGGRVRQVEGNPGPSYNLIGLSVSIPLPLRNNYNADYLAARADADAAAATLDNERLAAKARLEQTRSRYVALRAATLAFRQGRTAALTDRTKILERLWETGEIGTSDYLLQLKQSLDTGLSGLQLQRDAWQAWVDVETASNQLLNWLALDHDKDSSP